MTKGGSLPTFQGFFYKLAMPFLLFKFAPFPLLKRLVMVR